LDPGETALGYDFLEVLRAIYSFELTGMMTVREKCSGKDMARAEELSRTLYNG